MLCSVANVVDDVFEGLAGDVAADLVDSEAEGAMDELGRRAGDVWGDEAVWGGPEGVSGRERLGVGDVDGGADVVGVEGADEVVGVDDGAARGVDEEGASFHESHFACADERACLGGEGDDEDDDVGGGEEIV